MSKISRGIIRAKSGFRIAEVDSNTMLNDSKCKGFHANPKIFYRIAKDKYSTGPFEFKRGANTMRKPLQKMNNSLNDLLPATQEIFLPVSMPLWFPGRLGLALP